MFDFMEIGWPIFDRGVRLVSLKKSLSLKKQKLDLSPQSLEHQMICDTYNDLIYEYNEMICYLGYVLLFGVAAPLTPFIVLVFAYIEKYFDTYKIFFLVRVELVSMSKGLEIYNVISVPILTLLPLIGLVLTTFPSGTSEEFIYLFSAATDNFNFSNFSTASDSLKLVKSGTLTSLVQLQ
jgi:hypothetical protein